MDSTIVNRQSSIVNDKSRSVVMANPQRQNNFQASARHVQQAKLELLAVEVGGIEYALRAAHVVRLLPAVHLIGSSGAEGSIEHPAFVGFVPMLELPVFDLAVLLGLVATPDWTANDQIVIMSDMSSEAALAVGILVARSAEVTNVLLSQLVALPLVVEYNQTKAAAWALWPQDEEKVTVLIDPLAAL